MSALLQGFIATVLLYVTCFSDCAVIQNCRYNYYSTVCEHGEWPQDGPPFINASTRYLSLVNVTFPLNSASIPPLVNFTQLSLTTSRGVNGQKVPLRRLLENATRAGVTTLLFTHSDLVRLDENDVANFTDLRTLHFTNCSLRTIHPRAFGGRARRCPIFGPIFPSLFLLSRDRHLSVFPWNALLAFYCTMDIVQFEHNLNLTEINFHPDGDTLPSDRWFYELKKITVLNNTKMLSLSRPAAELIGHVEARNITVQNTFNCDVCSGSALDSWISWARGGANPTSRLLEMKCTFPNVTTYTNIFSGATQFWRLFKGSIC